MKFSLKMIPMLIIAYLFIGVLCVKALSIHHKSMVHATDSTALIGLLVVAFPVVLLVDGCLNIGFYELGRLVVNDDKLIKEQKS